MRIPIRRSVVGIVAALTLAVTACGSDTGGNGRTSHSEDPMQQLASSVEALNEETFKIEMTVGDLISATGAVDGPGRAARMAVKLGMPGQSQDMEIIFTETDMWIRSDLGPLWEIDTPWVHLDASQVGAQGIMGFKPGETDFAGAAKMMEAVTNVERVDDTTFRGEVDRSKVQSTVVDEELPAGNSTLPFTAILDDQGRLTELRIDFHEVENAPSADLTVRYYDFGQPVDISPPPADEVSEAPPELYQTFGNS